MPAADHDRAERKIVYSMIVSLDGFIEDQDGRFDWYEASEELHTFLALQEAEVDTQLYGRRMYEVMAAFWPTADQDPDAPAYVKDYARTWRQMPKIVFSTTLDHVDHNARLVRGGIAEEVARLKAAPGQQITVGGAGIAAAFMQRDLIDEVQLYVQPVVVGGGKPCFPSLARPRNLQLIETHTFTTGAVFLRYRRLPVDH